MRMSRDVGGPTAGLGCLLLFALVTAGCSSSADSQNGSLGEKALKNLTSLERTILADKSVTPGEYERAVQDTVGCLRTSGFTVSEPIKAPGGTLKFQTSYSPPKTASAAGPLSPSDMNKISAKENACEQRSAAAQAVFILQHAASEQERQQAVGVLITCAQTHGVKISVARDSQDIGKIMTDIDNAKRQGLITDVQANSCKDTFGAATLRPLTGLSEALAQYKG